MDFHRFYFDRGGIQGGYNLTLCSPHVRLLGDVAVLSYVRLMQVQDESGKPLTQRSEETRIWQRQAAGWRRCIFIARIRRKDQGNSNLRLRCLSLREAATFAERKATLRTLRFGRSLRPAWPIMKKDCANPRERFPLDKGT